MSHTQIFLIVFGSTTDLDESIATTRSFLFRGRSLVYRADSILWWHFTCLHFLPMRHVLLKLTGKQLVEKPQIRLRISFRLPWWRSKTSSIGQPIGENIQCQEFVVFFPPVVVCTMIEGIKYLDLEKWSVIEAWPQFQSAVTMYFSVHYLHSDSCIINHCQILWDSLMQKLS